MALKWAAPGVRRADNVLKRAPHTADVVMAGEWARPYSREKAAFPAAWVRTAKFWPTVSRVDNVYGDRHLVARLPQAAPEVRALPNQALTEVSLFARLPCSRVWFSRWAGGGS